jgi:hypothetical protein
MSGQPEGGRGVLIRSLQGNGPVQQISLDAATIHIRRAAPKTAAPVTRMSTS